MAGYWLSTLQIYGHFDRTNLVNKSLFFLMAKRGHFLAWPTWEMPSGKPIRRQCATKIILLTWAKKVRMKVNTLALRLCPRIISEN